MTTPFQSEDPDLEEAIKDAFLDLKSSKDDEETKNLLNRISRLHDLRNERAKIELEYYKSELKDASERDIHHDQNELEEAKWKHQLETENRPFYARVDPSTALVVLGNLVVAVLVIKHEETAAITTKIGSFLRKT